MKAILVNTLSIPLYGFLRAHRGWETLRYESFNSVVWILYRLPYCEEASRTFNSIVWILPVLKYCLVKLFCYTLSIPLYGFLSSTSLNTSISAVVLSIPLYGFGGDRYTGNYVVNGVFQFHCMDSSERT